MTTPDASRPLLLGQHHRLPWAQFVAAFQGIVDRSYYANGGPLVRRVDAELGPAVGTRHAVAVANETIAVMCAARALDLSGPVAVPVTADLHLIQGLVWGLADVVLVDVSTDGSSIDCSSFAADDRDFVALCATLRPDAPGIDPSLRAVAKDRGVPLLVDATRAFGCSQPGQALATQGDLTILGFADDQIIGAGQGGVVALADDALADRVRDCRSFHVAASATRVVPRINGKMAEAPAALILAGIEDLPRRVAHNRDLVDAYSELLGGQADLRVLRPAEDIESTFSELWVELDAGWQGPDAPALQRYLAKNGVQAGILPDPEEQVVALGNGDAGHLGARWPNALALRQRRLRLPVGGTLDQSAVQRVCALLRSMLRGDPRA